MTFIVAFGGQAGHGKSTCAEIAANVLRIRGYNVHILAFGDRVKEACKTIFRLTDHDLRSPIGKATYRHIIGTTPRVVMQKFATEVCRQGISELIPELRLDGHDGLPGASVWTWNVYHDILEILDDVPSRATGASARNIAIIIQDLRFSDETEMLRGFTESHGADVMFIHINRFIDAAEDAAVHQSEFGLSHEIYDYHIINDSGLAELRKKLEDIGF